MFKSLRTGPRKLGGRESGPEPGEELAKVRKASDPGKAASASKKLENESAV